MQKLDAKEYANAKEWVDDVRLIFYNAPAVNEKIEIKFAPEEYNFEY